MKLPRHVAVIMDGNGRWASQRGLPRVAGHKVGAESAREVIETCIEQGIEVLTLFAFSTENWERPPEEVNYLLGQLLARALEEELDRLHETDVQIRVIGDLARLDPGLQQQIRTAEKQTAANPGLKLVIALSYSGRWDIVQAVQKIVRRVEQGELDQLAITPEVLQTEMCGADLPPPDLLIRTSGEQRLSNFMLWQLAYTELYFTEILWPDFRREALLAALAAYAERSRRFGRC